jgi:DMSO/TMAO reductase YedYZ molybdopterin-dependent catalytic subunit
MAQQEVTANIKQLRRVATTRIQAIEKEACEILNLTGLREYFRKPGKGGFWEDRGYQWYGGL